MAGCIPKSHPKVGYILSCRSDHGQIYTLILPLLLIQEELSVMAKESSLSSGHEATKLFMLNSGEHKNQIAHIKVAKINDIVWVKSSKSFIYPDNKC